MKEVGAWLLELVQGLLAAVGEREMVHLLPDKPALFEIPYAPVYCRHVLVWQGEVLPLMNLAKRVLGRAETGDQPVIVITAFQDHSGAQAKHAALALSAPPNRIWVNDSQACELPDSSDAWRTLTIACFEQPDCGPVPILALDKVFSLPPGDNEAQTGQHRDR